MRDAPLSADQVAEITLQAVLRGTFYVLPHEDVRKGLARRAAAIVEGCEPAMGRLPEAEFCRRRPHAARSSAALHQFPTKQRPNDDAANASLA